MAARVSSGMKVSLLRVSTVRNPAIRHFRPEPHHHVERRVLFPAGVAARRPAVVPAVPGVEHHARERPAGVLHSGRARAEQQRHGTRGERRHRTAHLAMRASFTEGGGNVLHVASLLAGKSPLFSSLRRSRVKQPTYPNPNLALPWPPNRNSPTASRRRNRPTSSSTSTIRWIGMPWGEEAFAQARSGEQAHLPQHRLLDLPLVPRHGA